MTLKKFAGESLSIPQKAAWAFQIIGPWATWKMQDYKVPDLEPGLITYGRLAEEMKLDPRAGRSLRHALGNIDYFCQLHDIPALNSLVVNQKTMEAGSGIPSSDRKTVRKALAHNWMAYRFPSPAAFRKAAEKYDE